MSSRLAVDVNGAEVVVTVAVRGQEALGRAIARREEPWTEEGARRRIKLWIVSEASRCPKPKLPALVAILNEIVAGLVASYEKKPGKPVAALEGARE